jgi:predicted nucleotidyltransferase
MITESLYRGAILAGMETVAQSLRRRRREKSMSQNQLADLAGIPQPNLSAYENGRRVPSQETLQRLDAALASTVSERFAAAREEILSAAARRGLSDVRVFGSVARGDAAAESDLDLLVHPGATSSIFDLAAFRAEVEEIVGAPVDVVSDRATGPTMSRILSEALPV